MALKKPLNDISSPCITLPDAGVKVVLSRAHNNPGRQKQIRMISKCAYQIVTKSVYQINIIYIVEANVAAADKDA